MKKIYIISTPYHLLISIVKTILAQRIGMDDIIVYNFYLSENTIKNISKIFSTVYPCNHFRILAELMSLKIKVSRIPFISKNATTKFGAFFFQSKEIYAFNDDSYFGCLFNTLKIDYNLIEDGLNFYSYDTSKIKLHSKLYDFLGFSWKSFGYSKFTKSVEVNDINNICLKHPNIIEVDREHMFMQLKDAEIDAIAKIFEYQPLNMPSNKTCSMLLTQPLSEDGFISHSKKIKLYKYLVEKYAIGTLYIKAHPREKEDYSKIFPNAVVIKNNKIPFEIFLLKEKLHFKRVISAFTTAMDAIFCADEKIQMGLEWTMNFGKEKKGP